MKLLFVVLTGFLYAATVSARGGRTNPRNVNWFTRSEREGTVTPTRPKKNTLDAHPYRASPLSSRTLDETVRVIIGGAGMSGVSAASTLASFDMDDYMILEASQRIGGRMYPVTLGSLGGTSYTVERGANWCQGNEPFLLFCQELGLDGFEDFFETNIFDSNGVFSQANTEFEVGSECAKMDETYEQSLFLAELCVVPGSETVLDSTESAMCNVLGISQPENADDFSFEDVFLAATGWNPNTQSDPAMAGACECEWRKQTDMLWLHRLLLTNVCSLLP